MERAPSALENGKETPQHPHWALVERVAASQYFQSSARLRDFLFYVAECALKNAPEEATEQQIGIHVFQRHPGYNSTEDSIVRTHARSVRQKLAEYFQHEGSYEQTIIEIPKGHYLPVFRPRVQPPLPPATPAVANERKRPRKRLQLLVPLLVVGLLCAGWWGMHAYHAQRLSAIDRLWSPFFADNGSLIIYSNALFVGDSTNGLRYAPAATDANAATDGNYVDTYTGVGELTSIYDLTRLFDSHHATFTLKRSLLVSWDEAKLKNLVFIGSVAENPALRVLPANMDFTLTAGNGSAGIVNHHPRPGEQALYSRPEHPLTRDYAIIALLPGLVPGRKTLVFSGLMTLGTQAAVEFACRPESLEQLLRVAGAPDGSVRPFEAVVETTLGGGVPLETKLVAIHIH